MRRLVFLETPPTVHLLPVYLFVSRKVREFCPSSIGDTSPARVSAFFGEVDVESRESPGTSDIFPLDVFFLRLSFPISS